MAANVGGVVLHSPRLHGFPALVYGHCGAVAPIRSGGAAARGE